jgi:P pilus assembly chaperone PapD
MRKQFIIFTVLLLVGLISSSIAHALLLTERQVLLNPNDRSGVVTIKNVSEEAVTYRLEMTDMVMKSDGKIEFIDTATADADQTRYMTARDYVRYSPRRVVLSAGQVQQVRIMPRRKGNMASGEYRTYLTLKTEPPVKDLDEQISAAEQPEVPNAEVKTLVSWRIPIILRHGDVTLVVDLKNIRVRSLGGSKYRVDLDVLRAGNISAIGAVKFYCAGSREELSSLKVRIYPELDRRAYSADMEISQPSCRSLRLEYVASKDDPVHKGAVVTSTSVNF